MTALVPDAAPPTGTLQRQSMIDDAASLRVGERFSFPAMTQLDDTAFSASELAKSHRAIVLAMTSAGCPLSTMYAPRVAALENEYAPRRVAFVHVNVVDAESKEEMRQFVRDNRLRGAYIPDKDRAIRSILSPRTTTEVFVFDPSFTLIYRGAIDDQFGVGTARDAAGRQFLRDALDAFLAGESPKIPATWAPGCLVDSHDPGTGAVPPLSPRLTYMGRISRIIDAHCVECHRPFGVAPFSLATYQDIAGRARMIEAVVRDGIMPPSHGPSVTGAAGNLWVNPREIPESEKADLLAWLDSPRPLGALKEAPLPLERPRGWTMGTPDLLLNAGPLELPLDGPMQYVRSIVPTNLAADRWVTAIECRPMKQNAIHHALVWLLPPGATVPGVNEIPAGLELLIAYSPGQGTLRYDAGIARRIPAGSMLLVDMYARPKGRLMAETLRIALSTSDAPPQREVRSFLIRVEQPNGGFSIEPRDPRSIHQNTYELASDATVLAYTAYMRSRGVAMSLAARPARTAAREVVLTAPRYDYRWQLRHEYAEPRRFPRGAQFSLASVHDNSGANPNNADPSRRVHSGPFPADDTCFVSIEVLSEVQAERAEAPASN